MTGSTPAETRKTRRIRTNFSCKIFCDKAQAQAQVIDISTGGSRVQITGSVLADFVDEDWQIELPDIGVLPIKLIWRVAPDHGLAFQIDEQRTNELVTWMTGFIASGE